MLQGILWPAVLVCLLAGLTASNDASAGQPATVVLIAVGDIGSCESDADEATARLLVSLPGTIAALGDIAYSDGTPEEFAKCYAPAWGRFKGRTRPAPGNHDYHTDGAAGYFGYFGQRAGPESRGWYSYELGAWHVVSLNSNCGDVGCEAGSEQVRWLRRDLAAHARRCVLAYWHHPLFSSGKHGSAEEMRPIWEALYAAGADVVLNGHEHHYERFAPQTPHGRADPRRGLRQFVVGTGGKSLRNFEDQAENSEVRNSDTFGVLKLTLLPTSYRWRFMPVQGKTFRDSGRAVCH
jgi:hypothetical protein